MNSFIQDKIRILCENLQQQSVREYGCITGLEFVKTGYKTDNTPPQTGWQPFPDAGIAGGKDGGALFVKGQPPRAVHGDLAEILLAEIQRILQ